MRTSALACLMAVSVSLSGCFWENFQRTERVRPEVLSQPASAAELVTLVRQAGEKGKSIRMTGSGHSPSDVAVNDQYLLMPQRLNRPLEVDVSRLKLSDTPDLVRVQSGMRIRELNSWLDARGRALINLGGYDGQTIAGVMMTATHGSGLNYGPIESQAVSLQVVGEGGQMFQVEPTEGITDPALFPGTLEEDPAIPVTLIQDDMTFQALKVSIGSMGVVYAVTLRTDRKFWLREVRSLHKWADIKKPDGLLDQIRSGATVDEKGNREAEHIEFQYNPYALGGDRSILVTRRYRSYEPLATTSPRGQPGTEALSGLITVAEKPLTWIINRFPGLAPLLIEQSLKSQVDDDYSNVSYKVFNIGIVNYTDAIAIEMAFNIDETVAAMERAFALADELKAAGMVHSAPVAVRFVKPSDALIAMQNGRATMMLEIIIVQGVKGDRELLRTYEQRMMEEFGARPHWGLDLKILEGDAWAKVLYPRWNDWLSVYQRFNANGTFDGRVTDRLGISMGND
jgi:hypothetical protein